MQNELSGRFLEFGANIIKLTTNLYKTPEGRHIGGQLLRSGTSSGANYEEACGAESRRDFIHKLQITLKELKESFYWLRLIRKAVLISEKNPLLSSLLEENKELIILLLNRSSLLSKTDNLNFSFCTS